MASPPVNDFRRRRQAEAEAADSQRPSGQIRVLVPWLIQPMKVRAPLGFAEERSAVLLQQDLEARGAFIILKNSRPSHHLGLRYWPVTTMTAASVNAAIAMVVRTLGSIFSIKAMVGGRTTSPGSTCCSTIAPKVKQWALALVVLFP